MKISKALLVKAGILPKLRLGNKTPKGVRSTGQHKVKIIEDKIIKKLDPNTGKDVEWVRYFLEENGEKKIYDTKLKDKTGQLSYLVQRFAEIHEGQEILIEMKKQGIKNYIEVSPVGMASSVEIEDENNDETEETNTNESTEKTEEFAADIPF